MAFDCAWMGSTTVRIVGKPVMSGLPTPMTVGTRNFGLIFPLLNDNPRRIRLLGRFYIGTAKAWLLISDSNCAWLTGAFTFRRSPLGVTLI
jgi:hypothetical protein